MGWRATLNSAENGSDGQGLIARWANCLSYISSAQDGQYCPSRRYFLRQDLRHHTSANSPATFADRKAQLFFHRNRRNQSHVELQVVARHHHFGARWQFNRARYVRGAEVKLRAVVREERGVTA